MTDTRKTRGTTEDKYEENRRRDAEYFEEMHRLRAANEAKTARLRQLRLEKEAADRASGASVPKAKPKPRRPQR